MDTKKLELVPLFDEHEFFSHYRDLTPADQNLEPTKYFTDGKTVNVPRDIRQRLKRLSAVKPPIVVERYATPAIELAKEPTARLIGII